MYRLFAIFFAVAGVIIFIILYLQNLEGDIGALLRKPAFVIILLVPFLPSVILSMISRHLENKYFQVLDKIKGSM